MASKRVWGTSAGDNHLSLKELWDETPSDKGLPKALGNNLRTLLPQI
jgi:hypothetical protein